MIRITYASTALKEWSPEDLLKLLKECRTNNGAKNITNKVRLCERSEPQSEPFVGQAR